MTVSHYINVDLYCGGGGASEGWGSACRDCLDEPHDCGECIAWAAQQAIVAGLMAAEGL